MIEREGRETITSLGDDPNMPESDFWVLIDLLQGKADDAGCERLRNALSSRKEAEIGGFEGLLDAALATLDTSDHRDPPMPGNEGSSIESELPFSDDSFLYVRCDVVASGRDTWLHVANNPAAMVGPWDLVSERLLTVVPSLRRNSESGTDQGTAIAHDEGV
jgi:hypothetical protein